MPVDVYNSSTVSGDASVSSSGNQNPPPKFTVKKKRSLPGMPDPDAEVIALSPKTLMATNRFVCEICNKGFQRDQNLQLHRRGHNLPWKIRQRSSKEVKKRVYVCPEPTCVHHDPSRALGDLTGIKKHFCRKHGEKKWKCDKCSKKYAVQSDWKAHSKICGTREYKCDCGTLFSRRDSFITHRAFCDTLAEESAKVQTDPSSEPDPKVMAVESSPPPALQPTPPPVSAPAPLEVQVSASALPQSTSAMTSSVMPIQSSELAEDPSSVVEEAPPPAGLNGSCSGGVSSVSNGSSSSSSSVFVSLFASSTASVSLQPPAFTSLIRAMGPPDCPADLAPSTSIEPISLCLSTSHGSSTFGNAGQERQQYVPPQQPAMSATALLQKAAQMGAAASNASLLRGLGVVSSSSSAPRENLQWGQRQVEPNNASVAAGLGFGIPCDGSSGLKELMMGTPVFGPKQTTLDFLGLGVAASGSPNGGLSALITSIGSGLDVAAATASSGGGDFKDIKEIMTWETINCTGYSVAEEHNGDI
ncbi:Protein indeterminate-domain 2 [Hibiscus syriacus]|uniref:Protein indeterminate-domain 2 n=1 Tax=Hibiscus syriacus TaxID=106335 RepID=A0A6A2ZPM2_HIBSY|nr:zinc finger protein GAI-ASSOCIATED FACTOR 1-like [Hibiscus syriacus]KAE8693279.1 Protein indeterminate-domain 2 [Hibiscus syriacus]